MSSISLSIMIALLARIVNHNSKKNITFFVSGIVFLVASITAFFLIINKLLS